MAIMNKEIKKKKWKKKPRTITSVWNFTNLKGYVFDTACGFVAAIQIVQPCRRTCKGLVCQKRMLRTG